MELQGRVAVVTGAASGIGWGMAHAFARRGMRVVLADIDEAALADAAARLDAECIAVPTDVRDPASVQALADAAWAAFGAAHVVCNNAGVVTVAPQWETSEADWRWVLDVNLMGVVHGIRAFVPRFIEQGAGYVVSTASMGGLITTPMTGPYGASKHAVVGISKGLRAELRIVGAPVGVSVVCPGEVSTGIVRHLRERGGTAAPSMRTLDKMQSSLDGRGIAPEQAGEIVADGVAADQFWIFPNAAAHLHLLRADLDELFSQAPQATG